MTGGFGAVPEELYRTANQIGDVIGSAAGLLWQGPSGDYGHPGVQTGWGSFIDEVKSEVEKLARKAEGHGEDLRTAAGKYAESDTEAGDVLGKFGPGLAGSLGGHGVIGGILESAGEAGKGLGESKIGAGLEGVPGGGFTGGLTPTELNERFEESAPGKPHDVPGGGFTGGATGRITGSIDEPTGIMSPERSKELFPDSQPDERGEGPVY